MALPPRTALAQLPTPLEPLPRLSREWGGPTIWVKRDDLTGFGLSGNKVRKLEFHLAAARNAGATTLITCGAVQSNHCRATAVAGAREGFEVVLLLRSRDGAPPHELSGNHLLQRLTGAEARFITPGEYARRDELMADVATEIGARGGTAWVIPEGASDALGMWAFVLAAREVAEQWSILGGGPVSWWHGASSGGTTAGMGWGVDRLRLDVPIVGVSVGDPADQLHRRIAEIWAEAAAPQGAVTPRPDMEIIDRYVGLGYGKTTSDELAVEAEVSRLTGLILDPTYTGKAFYALFREIQAGRFTSDEHVILWHTGGGFAVFAHDFSEVL